MTSSADPMGTRVLVAEDSVTQRELLVSILESDAGISVVGQARTGAEAVDLAASLKPDVITMDVHMPVLDGIGATKQIMSRTPTPIIIVSGSSIGDEVQASLDAIGAGALMLVSKPRDPRSAEFDAQRAHLISMVKSLSQVKVVRRGPLRSDATPAMGSRRTPTGATYSAAGLQRTGGSTRSRLVAIAASTGGPSALDRLLRDLPADFAAPILVVQHIATGFVDGLARWLGKASPLEVCVAVHGTPVRNGVVYLAPDDRQLGISPDGRLLVSDSPPVGGFRPSASHLFESAARAYGPALAAVVLTGMGSDGTSGLRAVKTASGRVVAQDEATSVVYGMPREAVLSGLVDLVVPLPHMAPTLISMVTK